MKNKEHTVPNNLSINFTMFVKSHTNSKPHAMIHLDCFTCMIQCIFLSGVLIGTLVIFNMENMGCIF
jgi:hypothetical protein